MIAFAHSLPALHEGNQNGYVLGLQAALIQQGHHELDGTGYFGSVTKAAVQAWQRKNGINPSGLVGVQTWSSLIINDRYVPGKLPAPQLAPGGRWTERTGYVEEGILRLTQVFPSWAPAVGIRNGSYQASEVRVVQRFQQRSGINPSGIIGRQTTNAIKVVSALTGGFAC